MTLIGENVAAPTGGLGTEHATDPDRAPGTADERGHPILELDTIWQIYGEGDNKVEAVRGVSLTVWPEEFVAITGPSGSGKSTYLHIVGLLEQPTKGNIFYRGLEVSRLNDSRVSGVRNREVGFIFQAFHLLPRLSALENVELPLLYRGMPAGQRREKARDALSTVGLADRLDHRPSELSGGQRQRVAIARALVGDPALILADEPTGNLDSKTGVEVLNLLRNLNDDLGVTLVLITHDPEVAAYADKEYRMRDGILDLVRAQPIERVASSGVGGTLSRALVTDGVANPLPPVASATPATATTPAAARPSLLVIPPTVQPRMTPISDDDTTALRGEVLSGEASGGEIAAPDPNDLEGLDPTPVIDLRANGAAGIPDPNHATAATVDAEVDAEGTASGADDEDGPTISALAPRERVTDTNLDASTSQLLARDTGRLALGTLRGNRMRTALTSLGVIIGVMSVVLLIALGEGLRKEITAQIEGLGSNLIIILPGELGAGGGTGFQASPLRLEDIDAIEAILGPEAQVGAGLQSNGQVQANNVREFTQYQGTAANFPELNNRVLAEGRYFTEVEFDQARNVAVIGSLPVQTFFGGGNPIGQNITVNGTEMEIIGIFEEMASGLGGLTGFDQNNFIYLPLTTLQRTINANYLSQLFVKAPDQALVDLYSIEIDQYLASKYPDTQFSVLDQEEFRALTDTLLGILTLALTGIASISLVVGGIGIMNVTLVAVTERTKEIGVRRAVGARARHILIQFLLEAVVTSGVGGAIGLALAVGIATLISVTSPIPATITPMAVLLAIVVSSVVGVFFGVWPARRAAKLDPVEALRHE